MNAERAWRSIGTSFERAVDGITSELGLATSGDALVVSSVECDAEAGLLTLRLARELAASGRHPLVADLGVGSPTLGSLLVGIGLLARPERSAPVQRWFLPGRSDRDEESWIGFADSSIGLTSVPSQRWQTSSKSSLAAAADVLILFTPTWAREDEPPSLAAAALTQAPCVLVVPAGGATVESIRRHADAAVARVGAARRRGRREPRSVRRDDGTDRAATVHTRTDSAARRRRVLSRGRTRWPAERRGWL